MVTAIGICDGSQGLGAPVKVCRPIPFRKNEITVPGFAGFEHALIAPAAFVATLFNPLK